MLNLETFQRALHEIFDDYRNAKFLLAVSGGVDSMVLLNLFQVSGFEFQVAHVNYHFREEDSDLDQKLVENFCTNHDIQFHLKDISEQEKSGMKSLQNWARNLRYDFFFKVLKEENLDFIVTAHHLNDELETFLINLSRGSGIKGLSGIPKNENQILRPLLHFSKTEIYDFAKENNLEFREDKSNQKNDYLRNKIRNTIVPELLGMNENFLENFGKSISYLNQTKDFVQAQILKIEKETICEKDSYLTINKALFFKESEFAQFEILQKFGFSEAKELKKIRKAEVGKTFHSNEYELLVDRENLVLQKTTDEFIRNDNAEITILPNKKSTLIFPETVRSEIKESGSFTWKFDEDKMQFPLKIRRKKEGDLFYPIGMIGKKKISKFFKDEKIPILAQQKIWLLCDGNDKILGIIPFRQDRRFASTKESKAIIKVKL